MQKVKDSLSYGYFVMVNQIDDRRIFVAMTSFSIKHNLFAWYTTITSNFPNYDYDNEMAF